MKPNCPHCGSIMTSLRIEAIDGKIGAATLKCITLACPFCNKAISAQIDPIAIKSDTVDKLVQALRH